MFVAEISSNHNGDLQRCQQLIAAAATAGCHAVKFQLFRVEKLFAPEILQVSAEHRLRRRWELPPWFLPELATCAHDHGLLLGCTPFDLEAVDLLVPQVDFLKIASYELPWLPLVTACATTGLPLMMSTGMATRPEITAAVKTASQAGCKDLTLFHCVSSYPTPPRECNLAAIGTLRTLASALAPSLKVGWSDHSVNPEVISRAVSYWAAEVIEFHFDLEGQGLEFGAGHCWLPATIASVLNQSAPTGRDDFDGDGHLGPSPCEKAERPWRADPQDGWRPQQSIRQAWASQHPQAQPTGPRLLMIPYGPGWGHLMRCVALAETLRDDHQADVVFLLSADPGQAAQLQRHGLRFIAMPSAQDHWSPQWLRTFRLRLTALVPTGLDAAVVDTTAEPEPIVDILAEFGVRVVLLDKPEAPPATLGIVPSLTWSSLVSTSLASPSHVVGGPEFLLIREDVRSLRPQVSPTTCDGPIVISFGGTDPHHLTELCLSAVAEAIPEAPVQVVVGPGFIDREQRLPLLQKTGSGIQIILTAEGLEKLVVQAGLMITALGITVAETMCLGRPCAVIGFRPQDEAEISQLVQAGLVVSLGQHPQAQTKDIGYILADLWGDKTHRLDLAQAGWSYCHGKGAPLAASHIMAWLKTPV